MHRLLHGRPRLIVHLLTTLAVLAGGFAAGDAIGSSASTTNSSNAADATDEAQASSPRRSESEAAALDPEAARRSRQPLESPGLPGGTWVSAGEPVPASDDDPGGAPADPSEPSEPPRDGDDPPSPPEPEPEPGDTPEESAADDPAGDDPADGDGEPAGDEPAEDPGDEPAEVPTELPEGPFVDPCLTGDASGCPPGEPGTILGGGGSASAALTDDIRFTIHPYLTKAEYPDLRCDPGFLTSDAIPVVITTDRPVGSGHIGVGPAATDTDIGDDTVWPDHGPQLFSTDSTQRAAWVLATAIAGELPPAGLEHGLHHCVRLPHDLPEPVGTLVPGSLMAIEAEAEPYLSPGEMQSARRTFLVRDLAGVSTERPPVQLEALDWDVLQVRVPQKTPSGVTSNRTIVYAEAVRDDTDATPCRTNPPYSSSDSADPRPLDRETLAAPDYRYDRDYDHVAVWNLVLRESTTYDVCVYWSAAGEVEREVWQVTTPNQLRVRARATEVATGHDWRSVEQGDFEVRGIGLGGCPPASVPPEDDDAFGQWLIGAPPVTCDGDGRAAQPERIAVEVTAGERLSYYLPDPVRVPLVDPDGAAVETRGCQYGATPVPCPERTLRRTATFEVSGGLCGGTGGCEPSTETAYEVTVLFELYDGPNSGGLTWHAWDGPALVDTTW